MGCARSQHSRGGVRGARSDEGAMMREIPFFSERDYLTRWVKYHSREWETLASLGWTTAYIGAGPRSKDALMIKPKTRTAGKRNPARRRAETQVSEQEFQGVLVKRKDLELYAAELNRQLDSVRVRRGGSNERVERLLEQANETLKGFGVEGFEDNEGYFVDYVNMGDTYDDTIYFDSLDGQFYAGSWGNFIESDEERFG